MKNFLTKKKSLSGLLLFFFSTMPLLASAASFSLENPLKFTSLEGLLSGIITIIMIVAVPIIIFFLIFAGFSYLTAGGNPEEIKKASRMFTYTIIGAVLILGAYAIRDIISDLVSAFTTSTP